MKFRTKITPSEEIEFKTFIEFISRKPNYVSVIMTQFNKWFADHKDSLQYYYQDHRIRIDYMEWCRHIFYVYIFDDYKNNLNNEIKTLIGE